MASAEHCLELVQATDKDRFLATLFAPDEKQAHLFALYAFNAEIERIPRQVSEPHIGEIRLQWWRDVVESIYRNEAQEHPVAAALAVAITEFKLPRQPVLNLIDAHGNDLYADPITSVVDLEGYLGDTFSAVIQLASIILSAPDSSATGEAAGLAGVAYGLARRLASLPANPNLIPPGETPKTLLSLVHRRYGEFLLRSPALPKACLAAFFPAALVPLYAKRLERNLEQLPRTGAAVPQWRRQIRLWRVARSEQF